MLEIVVHTDQGVCVTRDDASLEGLLALAGTGCHHREISSVEFHQFLPERIEFSCNIFVHNVLAGRASQVTACESGQATFRPGVGPMEFSPGFFNESNPNFTSLGFGEARLARFGPARQIVINDNLLSEAIYKEIDGVDACFVDLLFNEESFNSFFVFSQTAEHC